MKLYKVSTSWGTETVSVRAEGYVVAEDEDAAAMRAVEYLAVEGFAGETSAIEIPAGAAFERNEVVAERIAKSSDAPQKHEPLRRWELVARVVVDARSEKSAWAKAGRAISGQGGGDGVHLCKTLVRDVEDIDGMSRWDRNQMLNSVRFVPGGAGRPK